MEIDRREPVRLGESTQWIRIRAANARTRSSCSFSRARACR